MQNEKINFQAYVTIKTHNEYTTKLWHLKKIEIPNDVNNLSTLVDSTK